MKNFPYMVEQFADLRILRYNIPGFDKLPLNKKLYIYYLSEASLCGRDIIWDQNCEYNLWLRRCLGELYSVIDQKDENLHRFIEYYKRILFANGMHHHYSTDKLKPSFNQQELNAWVSLLQNKQLNLLSCSNHKELEDKLSRLLFDDNYMFRRVCQDENKDLLVSSANNFYQGVSQEEAERFYRERIDKADKMPVSYGLNSRLIKVGGEVKEEIWKTCGKYGKAITQIIYWLNKAAGVAENEQQKKSY